MDEYTRNHLLQWIATKPGRKSDHCMIYIAIVDFVEEHPEIVERGDSWPEILTLINRA